MRKLLSLMLVGVLFCMSGCAAVSEAPVETVSGTLRLQAGNVGESTSYPSEKQPMEGVFSGDIVTTSTAKPVNTKEVRGMWISFFELETALKGRSEASFRQNIIEILDNVTATGFNTVFVQVRPYADALYPSNYFPWSYLATGTEGVDPGFDPFAIVMEESKARSLRVEAWINPYRVRAGLSKDEPMSGQNQASVWLNAGNSAVLQYDGCVYYNPASKSAQELIVNGVKEIVERYDVDGIHFDDYFYPTTNLSFDKASYQQYRSSGGKLSQGDWRRENVNTLVRAVYEAIKTIDSSVVFGISPQGNTSNNYSQQFIDVEKWLQNPGYIDYICPQIYWGYNHKSAPFQATVEKWNRMAAKGDVALYVGMGAYRLGTIDSGAGSGKNEWKGTQNILSRMVQTSRQQSQYDGFVMFRYDSLYNPSPEIKSQATVELENLAAIFR